MLHKRNQRNLALSTAIAVLFIFLTVFTLAHFSAAGAAMGTAYDLHRHKPPIHRTATPRPRKTPTPIPTPPPTPTPVPGITPTATTLPAPTPPGTGGTVQVFVEPAAGEQVILNAINNAHQSIWLEMYLLTDTNIIQALENAAGRHLDERVMLEPHPFGGGSPQSTLDALKAAGASVEDTSPSFALTHEKGMIVDGTTAYIMTSNFTYSALNGKNREYGIIDTVPQDVQGTIDIFNADWNRSSVQVTDPNLIVSPVNARGDLTTLINGAQHTLIIEAEEMLDTGSEQASADAARRGVQVQVILPTPQKQPDPNSSGIATIKAAGVQVKEDPQLIMHAKMIVVDGTKGFVGSENFSSNSLDKNRELGLLLTDQQVLSTLQQTFQQDWSVSQSQIECVQLAGQGAVCSPVDTTY